MTKEKLASLTKYVQQIKQKLDSGTPPKHEGRPAEYKAFLERELRLTQNKINEALQK
jgi:hypothetical protein